MKTLGVNISHHPSICVFNNGVVEQFYNEERFNLKKNWIPNQKNFKIFQSILQKINFKPDFICYTSYGNSSSEIDKKIISVIQKQLESPPYFFNKEHHHIYHALTSFYFSGFEEAVAIVVDGGGAMLKDYIPYRELESIYVVNRKKIYPIYKHNSNRINQFKELCNDTQVSKYIDNVLNIFSQKSIGGKAFVDGCLQINFKADEAGKLMGLSSYAKSKEKFSLNYDYVKIANDVQEKTFNETCDLINKAKKLNKNILLSGGYFLNCSNNFKYVKKYPELNFFVDPIPNDAGTCIGACLYNEYYK